eukprot:CAMPEP_0170167036 /NCGR_PEP_ID=MMETSP0040_2-20121228/556_1 /TAXON_ID=641309 /ORGANISM="Lotharella oceanica, Strain CCMP622" /LENGTH=183 /DNA_ID=CAMNT_0010404935 /DNA_START=76 /DNA_END=624 /DNA_ORIENTATION=+
MPESYGTIITNRVEELISMGYSPEEIHENPKHAQVSIATLRRWRDNFMWCGSIRLQKRKRARHEYESGCLSPELGDCILNLLEEDPCLCLREIRDEIEWAGWSEVPSVSTIYEWLRNKGQSNKQLEEPARQAQMHEAIEYKLRLKHLMVKSTQMLTIDEMHADNKKFRRRRGWTHKGARCARQ